VRVFLLNPHLSPARTRKRLKENRDGETTPPRVSPDHSIGRSDGRCVQKAGTQSARADDSRLLGIPRWRSTITIIYPRHGKVWLRLPRPAGQGPSMKLAEALPM